MATTQSGQGNWGYDSGRGSTPDPSGVEVAHQQWFAINTLPQNERSVVRYLEMFRIETFLPTCESIGNGRIGSAYR